MRVILLLFLSCVTLRVWAQTSPDKDSSSSGSHIEGRTALATNYLERGISQTTKDPSLQADFWGGWGEQFKLGLLGANVSYPNGSDSHLRLALAAEINVHFSQNSALKLEYEDRHFYKDTDSRSGSEFAIGLNLYDWVITDTMIGNFEGTQTKATSYSLEKSWFVFTDWKWDNTVGYVMVNNPGWSNFFWYETSLGKKLSNIFYDAGLSYNSAPSQFSGEADLTVFLRATYRF